MHDYCFSKERSLHKNYYILFLPIDAKCYIIFVKINENKNNSYSNSIKNSSNILIGKIYKK